MMKKDNTLAFTAPHYLATEAGLDILRKGGSAVEAMVAAAAMITVVYPHMNAIGGDSFWLISDDSDTVPRALDACGRSASSLPEHYFHGDALPTRGGISAINQAGTLRGWQAALDAEPDRKFSLSELLQPAISVASSGFTVTESMQAACEKLFSVDARNDHFRQLYEPQQLPLSAGTLFRNPDLAQTFHQLGERGIDDFYTGELARRIFATLQAQGSPLSMQDLAATQAIWVTPQQVSIEGATLYNMPAPTQGTASLLILAIADRLRKQVKKEADWVHLLVESTKRAFLLRDANITDPASVPDSYTELLSNTQIEREAGVINLAKAADWPQDARHGDTIWMGARDAKGQMVSFIQSIYWEFGAGIVIEDGGFVWNNRGAGFSADPSHINAIAPSKKPFHTLNPAYAQFNDGRRLTYGTMGGEGQPQTQAAVFSRYAWRGLSLADSIAAGRWLLGRTWGDVSNNLKVEADLAGEIGDSLTALGHEWVEVPACTELMGHAGAIVCDTTHVLEAATDPRSDGAASIL